MNGDDDTGAMDESTAGAVVPTVDEEDKGDIVDEARFAKRRTTRRHPRPKFRSERKARRTPR